MAHIQWPTEIRCAGVAAIVFAVFPKGLNKRPIPLGLRTPTPHMDKPLAWRVAKRG
jgi:hypothetical protein